MKNEDEWQDGGQRGKKAIRTLSVAAGRKKRKKYLVSKEEGELVLFSLFICWMYSDSIEEEIHSKSRGWKLFL